MLAQESPRRLETSRAINLELINSLDRRRDESRRHPPLPCGRRDPLDPIPPLNSVAPMVAGLECRELIAEGRRLERLGWRSWELAARLGQDWRSGGGR